MVLIWNIRASVGMPTVWWGVVRKSERGEGAETKAVRERSSLFARSPRQCAVILLADFQTKQKHTGSDAPCTRGLSGNVVTMEGIGRGGKIGLVSAAIR